MENSVFPGEIAGVLKRAKHSLSMIQRDREDLEKIDRYARGLHKSPFMPSKANPEFLELSRRAIHNIIPLLVDAPTNALAVEGYRRSDVSGNPGEWQFWQANRMDQRQSFIHRQAIEAGHAYVTVLPSRTEPTKPEIRGHSPMRMFAAYDDPVFDAFPMYALLIESPDYNQDNPTRGKFFDDKRVYDVVIDGSVRVTGSRAHGLSVCPVVRFAPRLDLLGRAYGMVEGLLRLQDKLNQMWLNMLIAQHYTGFAIRTATGLAPMERLDENGMPMLDANGQPTFIPPILDPSTMLMSPNPDTKFGQLPSAGTEDFQNAIELVVQHMCAVTETPPHYMLSGKLSNLSADALAAAESAFTRKCDEYRMSFGESWEMVMRLCALVSGDQAGFDAEDAQVMWSDKGNRSLAQAVDAGLKLTQMGVPTDIVLTKVPGFSQQDIDEVRERLEDEDGLNGVAEKFANRLRTRESDEDPKEKARAVKDEQAA
ncbi:phage portal protein [Streptomyces vinaceus]|uniref:phage portal protein n=1 Tax=Streptomyces vinaceus TaxID=1960 RepID=UPI00368EBDA4